MLWTVSMADLPAPHRFLDAEPLAVGNIGKVIPGVPTWPEVIDVDNLLTDDVPEDAPSPVDVGHPGQIWVLTAASHATTVRSGFSKVL